MSHHKHGHVYQLQQQAQFESKPDKPEYVRELAYWLWEHSGRPQGQSERFWKEAEDRLNWKEAEGNVTP